MDKALHHAAAALLGEGGSSCLCCNTGSQNKAWGIHKQFVKSPSATQRIAGLAAGCACGRQGRQQDKGCDRGYCPASTYPACPSLARCGTPKPSAYSEHGAGTGSH